MWRDPIDNPGLNQVKSINEIWYKYETCCQFGPVWQFKIKKKNKMIFSFSLISSDISWLYDENSTEQINPWKCGLLFLIDPILVIFTNGNCWTLQSKLDEPCFVYRTSQHFYLTADLKPSDPFQPFSTFTSRISWSQAACRVSAVLQYYSWQIQ